MNKGYSILFFKKSTYLLIVTFIFFGVSCSRERLSRNSEIKTEFPNMLDEQNFILSFNDSSGRFVCDTLKAIKIDTYQCALTWKNDTITKEWSYQRPVDFISALGTLGLTNVFLIQSHEGDGCPSVYKILAFKNCSEYSLTATFGNCNEISGIKVNWPEIAITFEGFQEAGRKKIEYNYNCKDFTLKEL